MVAERRERVRSENHRQRRRRLVMAAGVVAALAGLVAAATSSLVGVRHVRISGNDRVDMVRIERLADVERGTAMLRLDTRAVEDRIATDPWVANATVVRSFPTTILVRITEERPLMVLRSSQGSALVSRTGRILDFAPASAAVDDGDPGRSALSGTSDDVSPDAGSDVPVVVMDGRIAADSPSEADLPGRRVSRSVEDLMRLVRNMPESIEQRVSAIDATRPTAIRMDLVDGSAVLMGPPEDVSAKMASLGAVLTGVDDRCVDRIDVRNPKRATVTRSPGCSLGD